MKAFGWIALAALLACDRPPEVPTVEAGEKAQQPAPAAHTDARSLCQDGIGALLGSLREPAEVVLYTMRSEPSISAFTDRVAGVLARFKALSKGKLVYRIVDAKTTEDRGLVVRYRGVEEALPILDPDIARGVEFVIAKKLREARDRGDDKLATIGVVTKKDEVALSEANLVVGVATANLRKITQDAFPYYRFEDVDLKSDIPADALIITQPGKDYGDEELRRIDAFVMRGGALAVFASAVNLAPADPSLEATLDAHRLDGLLAKYGVDMQIASVLDARAGLMVPLGGGHPPNVTLRVPSIVHVDQQAATVDSDSPIFFRLEELAVPFASPLLPHGERQPDAKLSVLLQSSPDASTNDAARQKVQFGAASPARKQRHVLAVALEGRLKSAFGDTRSAANARLLVVSSSQFLANPYARAIKSGSADPDLEARATHYTKKFLTGTILAFKNVLDWMTNDTRVNACSGLPLAP